MINAALAVVNIDVVYFAGKFSSIERVVWAKIGVGNFGILRDVFV